LAAISVLVLASLVHLAGEERFGQPAEDENRPATASIALPTTPATAGVQRREGGREGRRRRERKEGKEGGPSVQTGGRGVERSGRGVEWSGRGVEWDTILTCREQHSQILQ
jgi:hypothetical protein